MKSLTGIPGGVAPSPPAGVEPREPRSQAPAVSGEASPARYHSFQSHLATRSGTTPTAPAGIPGEELTAAAERLEETLARLPGPEREVHLLFEEERGDFAVEVRDKRSGDVIQRFPPEKLLNQGLGSADLLGTVIDRRS